MAEPTYQQQFQAGMELPQEKKYYFNGFTVGISPIDITIVLLHNNQPVALLNTPHTIAKTLIAQLEGLIKDFEARTKLNVKRLDELQSLLGKETKEEN